MHASTAQRKNVQITPKGAKLSELRGGPVKDSVALNGAVDNGRFSGPNYLLESYEATTCFGVYHS